MNGSFLSFCYHVLYYVHFLQYFICYEAVLLHENEILKGAQGYEDANPNGPAVPLSGGGQLT